MSEHVSIKTEGGVLEIRLQRAQKKNALDNAMYGAMADALERGERDAGVRAVLFTAEGADFCAGNDLADFAAFATGALSAQERQVGRFLHALASAEKPYVAAVQGQAVGVGATMLLHCDLVFVAEDARLSTPFVNLGLTPEAASSALLPARIGHARAFAMFALGEALSGLEAARLGLANVALPAGEVLAAAHDGARKLAQKAPGALRATKRLLRDAHAIRALMDAEGQIFSERLLSQEAREAFQAFLEKRPPRFQAG